MPLDAVLMSGLVREVRAGALGARVEKIQQPARDQVTLSFRGGRRLLLCAGADRARLQLTEIGRENPAAPPMFCMLLRKHLGNARLSAVEQPHLERAAILTFDVLDSFGEPGTRRLVLECMGRSSNLILLDGDGRIIDCLRRVDMEMSGKRQVLPGLFYRLPPAQDKADPLAVTEETFDALLSRAGEDAPADRALLDAFSGLSPLVCREIAARGELKASFFAWQRAVLAGDLTPYMLIRDGRPWDFTYLPSIQYGPAVEVRPRASFSAMLDEFYGAREKLEHMRQKGRDLQRCAANARDRLCRKLAQQEKEYARTLDRDVLRVRGELITANLYRMERGQASLECEDFYQEGSPRVTVPLDPLLTPQQNAAKYFRQYGKARTAETVLAEQMEIARRERDWLESVLDELSRAESEQDLGDIRAELQSAGYLRTPREKRRTPRPAPGKPRAFRSSGGYRILAGRSNSQNDALTRSADRRDYWFHTQRIHGSHVVLCTGGAEPDERSMEEAAILAAWFSQGRESDRVAVDYTRVKNVRKPAGSRPGMAVYDPYKTVYVKPDEALVKALAER